MHQRHVGLKVVSGQVRVVLRHLRRQQLALVDNGAARERAHKRRVVSDSLGGELVLDELAQDEVLRLRVRARRDRFGRFREEALLDSRFGRLGAVAERGRVGGDGPVPQHGVPELRRDLGDGGLGRPALARIGGQEEHPDGVLAGGRELREPDAAPALADDAREERVRDRDQTPGAVPRVVLAAAGPSVRHPHQHLQRVGDARAGGHAGQLADEADAARILVVGRVVEASCGRRGVVACLGDEGVAPAGRVGAPGRRGGGRGAELVGVGWLVWKAVESKRGGKDN